MSRRGAYAACSSRKVLLEILWTNSGGGFLSFVFLFKEGRNFYRSANAASLFSSRVVEYQLRRGTNLMRRDVGNARSPIII